MAHHPGDMARPWVGVRVCHSVSHNLVPRGREEVVEGEILAFIVPFIVFSTLLTLPHQTPPRGWIACDWLSARASASVTQTWFFSVEGYRLTRKVHMQRFCERIVYKATGF